MGAHAVNYFFAYLARLKYIRRWGLMRNSVPENDAEHTLQTAEIAHGLALIRQEIFGEPCDAGRCAVLALYHDAGEVFTGDLPTPVKYFSAGLRGQYGAIEAMARERLLQTLPPELRGAYRPFVADMEEDPLWPLVKAADTLSAYLKCMEERQAGNHEFDEAARVTEEKLRRMDMKEVDWFLAHFAGSFALTLDEMNRQPCGGGSGGDA